MLEFYEAYADYTDAAQRLEQPGRLRLPSASSAPPVDRASGSGDRPGAALASG